ncbi:MAG: hypothetical protein J0M00_26495 [Burkholderiales bacterium]|nr:hypothetical protein [Xanthomonadaceae bacterium]MBN8494981.1 hypothetical protein [Burkholderiales bacterium]
MSKTTMRAKFAVAQVEKLETGERISFHAVGRSGTYPEDGSDEDNSFAKFTPSADLTIYIANPALFGQFDAGQKYYADFTRADG